jgi:hypothetical protein
VTWSPDRQYYLDSYSRVDLPTVVELKRTSDRRTLTLEKRDMSAAVKLGFRPPEVFVSRRVMATDIWGIAGGRLPLIRRRSISVIEQIHAGPHGSFVPKTWVAVKARNRSRKSVSWSCRSMAWAQQPVQGIPRCGVKNIADAGFPIAFSGIRP